MSNIDAENAKKGPPKVIFTITSDFASTWDKFRKHCGLATPSAQIRELIRQFVQEKENATSVPH